MPQEGFFPRFGVFFPVYYIKNPASCLQSFPQNLFQRLEMEWDYDTARTEEVKFERIRPDDIFSYSVILVT